MKRNTNAFRYFPWLARDVFGGPGLIYLAVLAVVGVIVFRVRANPNFNMAPDVFQAHGFETVLLVAVLVASGAMVSSDIHNGFYRAWFSKPMAPWWYYLQRWLLGGILLLLAPLALGLILHLIHGDGLGITWQLMATLGLGYLLIGSAVFLASTWSRFDWLLVFFIATAQQALAQVRLFTGEDGFSPALETVYKALPPFHLIDPTKAMLTGRPLLYVVGYGLAMLVLALLILTYRPLGSGGRA